MQEPRCTPATGYRALVTLMFPPAERLRPPPLRAPITYVIDYSRRHWDDPGAIRAFADFMAISSSCDALMFESTYPPGARLPLARLRNPAGIPAAQAHATHIGQLLFSVHSPARAVLLDYACRKPGQEAMQELGLAQCAAFGNGAALAALGEPLGKYSSFFKRAAALYDGAEPYADIGLLYAFWGQNPGNMWRPGKAPSPADVLSGRHRLVRTVMDRSLSAADLAGLKSLVVCGHALELADSQTAAIRQFVARGGALCVFNPETTINGRPPADILGSAAPWSAVLKVPGHRPVIAARGLSRGLRFNVLIHSARRCLVLHAVNYNVYPSGRRAVVARAPGVQVRLTLPTGWEATSVMAHDPDKSAARKVACKQRGRTLVLGLPSVHIYCVVEIACRFVDSPAGRGLPTRREKTFGAILRSISPSLNFREVFALKTGSF